MPPVTPMTQEIWSGSLEQAHVDERVEVGHVAGVEALVLGADAQLAHRLEQRR